MIAIAIAATPKPDVTTLPSLVTITTLVPPTSAQVVNTTPSTATRAPTTNATVS